MSPGEPLPDLAELTAKLSGERQVWVRYVIDPGHEVRALEVSVHYEPPSWETRQWRYAQASFGAQTAPGPEVASWIAGKGETTSFPEARFDGLAWPANHERRPSGFPGQNEILEWPVDEWRASFTTQLNTIAGELIPGTGPVFRSFDLAVANLLGLTQRPGWTPPSPQLVIRRQDRSARIASVFVGQAGLDVTVEGDGLEGATLEVAGEVPGPTHSLGPEASQQHRFDTRLPDLAWLALHREGVLLDTRHRLERPPRGAEAEMGVTWEPEPDPADNSPFTLEEQEEIRRVITAVKFQLHLELGNHEDAARLGQILDRADESAKSGTGRIEWRERLYGALFDAALRDLITWPHFKLAFGLLRVGVRALTGFEIPAIGGG